VKLKILLNGIKKIFIDIQIDLLKHFKFK